MAISVIRKNADGIDVNFGDLVVCELAGAKCVMEDWRAEQLKVAIVETEVIPEFISDLKLIMQFAVAQVYVYPLDKEGIKPLGKALSDLDVPGSVINRVDVVHKGCILLMWKRGEVTSKQETIDFFYPEATEEEIERSRF